MRSLTIISLLVFLFLSLSCDQNDKSLSSTQPAGVVLAQVNDKNIYEKDLQNTLTDMFGEYQASKVDEQVRTNALQSLVASHAMADLSIKELDQKEVADIEAKVARYRVNQLISAYIKKNIVAEPISNVMIETYYQSHLPDFGQKIVYEYELLSSAAELSVDMRDRLLAAFDKMKNLKPAEIQSKLKQQGIDLIYHKGVTGDNLLSHKVNDFIVAQKSQQLSNITFIEGRVYVALQGSEITLPAKPLSEVRENIRKSLAMLQLKKSVKELSETALKQASVVYQ